jgi:hypothetical protein
MRLVDLLVLYLLTGTACAVALYRRDPGRGVLNAITALPLWPLWAPIAWTARHAGAPPTGKGDRLRALRSALDQAVASIAGTGYEALIDREAAKLIMHEAECIARRHAELVRLLAREEFRLDKAEAEAAGVERRETSGRVRASSRLHLENVRRLHHLAERDERALDELLALVTALHAQLMLMRLSGSAVASVDDVVSDLWAHIEHLRQASADGVKSAAVMD